MVTIFKNAKIVSGGSILENHGVIVKDGVIDAVLPSPSLPVPEGVQVIDLAGKYLSPAWIDLHCHGAGGYEFIDGTQEAIENACAIHARCGTQILYPTISATNFETTWRALEALEKAIPACPLLIPGVHLEGPYLSKSMCGAQDIQYITAPIPRDYLALMDRFGALIARWTYAPEEDVDDAFLKELTKRGIVPSMGHSAAEYSHVKNVFEKGCRLVTHLYSCTSTITRHSGFRHLGIIESSYLMDELDVEAIGDGCHLPPELLQLIVKGKGPEHVCLITDAISFAGMENSDALQGGTKTMPYLVEDGVAKLMDRSAFAGSIATTNVILKRTVAAGIPLEKTIQMMTETPARVMGLKKEGKIAPGYQAHMAVFDEKLTYLGKPE